MILGGSAIAQVPVGSSGSILRVSVTGVAGTGQAGSVTTNTDQTVSVTGVAATGVHGVVAVGLGTGVTINAGASVGTGQIGSISTPVGTGVAIPVTGLSATGSVGSVVGLTNVSISVAGIAATGAVTAVSQQTGQEIRIESPALLVTSVGTPTIQTSTTVLVTGVEASASVGSVLVWGNIVPGVTTIWTEIAA